MTVFINTLNGGEYSDLIDGRLDYAPRITGGRILENFIPLTQGPIASRSGTKYCGTVKTQASRTQLLGFINNDSTPFQVEMGEYYFRYWYNGSRITGTTANTNLATVTAITNRSPCTVTASAGHTFSNGDIVYFSGVGGTTQLNSNYYVVKNKSTSGTVTITGANIGSDALQFSSTTLLASGYRVSISGITGTLGTGLLNGNSYILDTVTSTSATLKTLAGVAVDFAGLVWGSGGTITISNSFEIHTLNSTAWSDTNGDVDSSAYGVFTSGGTAAWDGTAHCYSQSNIFSGSFFDIGTAALGDTIFFAHGSYWPKKLTWNSNTSWTFGNHTHINSAGYTSLPFFYCGPNIDQNIDTLSVSNNTEGGSMTITSPSALFASTDVGRTARWVLTGTNKIGFAIITGYTSSTVVTATLLNTAANAAATSKIDFFELGAYSDTTGYPRRVCFYQNRIAYLGTDFEATRVDFSRSNIFTDFSPCADDEVDTIEDFRGISVQIAASGTGKILWGHSTDKSLLVGTHSDVFAISGVDGETIKPSKIKSQKVSSYGCANMPPVEADGKAYFVQRIGRKIRSLSFDAGIDNFAAIDETRLSEHITDSGIVSAAFQADPYQSAYFVRDDGVIVTCTINDSEKVAAFAKQKVAGVFGSGNAVVECVSVSPSVSGYHDEIYIIVKRTVNGSTVRYIERFANSHLSDDTIDQNHTITVDSCVTYDSSAATTITGLSHLEGQAVAVVADGVVVTGKTVSGGQITLSTAASVVNVGLQYYPIWESMNIESETKELGLSAGRKKQINRVAIGFIKSVGCTVGRSASYVSEIAFSTTTTPTTAKITWVTGAKHEIFKGDVDEDCRIYIKQTYPLPICIKYISAEIKVSG